MPTIRITTTDSPDGALRDDLLRQAARIVAEAPNKAVEKCMVALVADCPMRFGDDTPAAFVEVKSIGEMPPEVTTAIARGLSDLLAQALGIAPRRTYIEFTEATRRLWGHNGAPME